MCEGFSYTLAPDDPITGQKTEDHLLPIVINRKVE